jgi:hypothetical protein
MLSIAALQPRGEGAVAAALDHSRPPPLTEREQSIVYRILASWRDQS